jgi:hypothetical protein
MPSSFNVADDITVSWSWGIVVFMIITASDLEVEVKLQLAIPIVATLAPVHRCAVVKFLCLQATTFRARRLRYRTNAVARNHVAELVIAWIRSRTRVIFEDSRTIN